MKAENAFCVRKKDIKRATKQILEGKRYGGIQTGFIDLDYAIGGFGKEELIVLGARPAMGKTSFALSLVANVTVKDKNPTLFFSLETSKTSLLQRLIKILSQSDAYGQKITDPEQRAKIIEAAKQVETASLLFDDSLNISAARIREVMYSCKSKPELVIVDYLQAMADTEYGSRNTEIGKSVRELKNLARETKCPIFVLSQLSRRVEHRQYHTPLISDLRGAGDIEEVADKILLLYRDSYYNRDTDKRGIAELIIAKSPYRYLGTIELGYNQYWSGFYSIERHSVE